MLEHLAWPLNSPQRALTRQLNWNSGQFSLTLIGIIRRYEKVAIARIFVSIARFYLTQSKQPSCQSPLVFQFDLVRLPVAGRRSWFCGNGWPAYY